MEKLNDEKMILNPNRWVQWPKLPLKKQGKAGLGVLLEDQMYHDGKYRVYLCNLWDRITNSTPFVDYDSVPLLLADGWIVD